MSKDALVVDIVNSLGPVPTELDPARFEVIEDEDAA